MKHLPKHMKKTLQYVECAKLRMQIVTIKKVNLGLVVWPEERWFRLSSLKLGGRRRTFRPEAARWWSSLLSLGVAL